VSTDKVDTEIPAPAAGTLVEIKVNEDETVPVGADLAVIGGAGSAPAPAPEKPAPEKPQPTQEQEPQPERKAEPEPAAQERKPEPAPAARQEQPRQEQPRQEQPPASDDGAGEAGYVTPLVRKLASEHRVDLSRLRGSGVGGRIRKQDVLEAAERQKAAEAKPEPARAAAAPVAKPEPSPLRGRTEKLTRMRATIARRMVESLQTSAQLTTVVEVDITR